MTPSYEVESLPPTERSDKGFGSNGTMTINSAPPKVPTDIPSPTLTDNTLISTSSPPTKTSTSSIIPQNDSSKITNSFPIKQVNFDDPTYKQPQTFTTIKYLQSFLHLPQTAMAAKLHSDIQTTFDLPYLIDLDASPYNNHTHQIVNIPKSNKHDALGMNIQMCSQQNLQKLIDCKPGTTAMKIIQWRSELKNGYITSFNNFHVNNIKDIKTHIKRQSTTKKVIYI
jgi:hypothetical protein